MKTIRFAFATLSTLLALTAACVDDAPESWRDPNAITAELASSDPTTTPERATMPDDPGAVAKLPEPGQTCSTPVSACYKSVKGVMQQGSCTLDSLPGVPGYICICDNGGTGCGKPE